MVNEKHQPSDFMVTIYYRVTWIQRWMTSLQSGWTWDMVQSRNVRSSGARYTDILEWRWTSQEKEDSKSEWMTMSYIYNWIINWYLIYFKSIQLPVLNTAVEARNQVAFGRLSMNHVEAFKRRTLLSSRKCQETIRRSHAWWEENMYVLDWMRYQNHLECVCHRLGYVWFVMGWCQNHFWEM